MDQYIGRIVTLLTPLFAGLAGWVVTFVAENMPGNPNLDATELTALFVTGAGSAAALAFKWLDGRQKHEERKENAASVGQKDPLNAYK